MNKSLGIIIVNYNSGELLKSCLESIFNSELSEIDLKVVVVDNNSRDESLNLDSLSDERLHIIENKKNLGFGRACNQGSQFLKEKEFLLLLNPDTRVQSFTLKKSLDFLSNEKEVSILGCCHLDDENRIKISCSRTPKSLNIVWDIIGLSKLMPRVFKPATLMTDFNHQSSRNVDQVMGAYMMFHKDVFDKLNGFDTRFFVFYEDADFALRAKQIGHKSYYNSEIKINHLGRGTTRKISDKSLFYNLRSRQQFVKKHYGKLQSGLILLLTLTLEPLTRIFFNLIKSPKENKNTVKAFKYLYTYYFFSK